MKHLIALLAFTLLLAAPMPSQGAHTAPLINHKHADFNAAGHTLTSDKVREAIVAAGAAHGWKVVAESPGQLALHVDVRNTHRVDVKISYDERGMTVDYVSSENLNYRVREGGARIHPKYNTWVDLLIHDTISRLSS